MDLTDRIPCPSGKCTTGWLQYSSLSDNWGCNQCAKKYTTDYIEAFYEGVNSEKEINKGAMINLKKRVNIMNTRISKLESDLRNERSKSKPSGAKIKSLSAADVKRIINEDAKRKELNRKTLPNPKDIEEYQIWSGAKLRRNNDGPAAKYYIKGYAADGHDVDDIIDWLHAM